MADISGTNTGDNLQGTSAADVIRGLGGNDTILGGAGDDRLVGGDGNDSLDGEFGHDKLFGGNGDDRLSDTSGGNDQLYGEAGNDHLYVRRILPHSANTLVLDGGAGDDTIDYVNGANLLDRVTILGGEGNDIINLDATAKAVVDAGAGDDAVTIGMGGLNQTVTLGAGADTLKIAANTYSAIRDVVRVTDFNAAEDRINLTDIIGYLQNWDGSTNPFATGHLQLVQSGSDVVLRIARYGAGDWQDLMIFSNSDAADFNSNNIDYDPDGSPLAGLTINGGGAADNLQGASGADTIRGWGGNDTILGGAGDDRLVGGDGNDSLDANTLVLDGGAGDDTIDYVNGANLLDRVTILGGEGNDIINLDATAKAVVDAGAGDDAVTIGMGGLNQTVTLGTGADALKITGNTYSVIRDVVEVTDFNAAEDVVDLTGMVGYLQNWNGSANPFATGHLQLLQLGSDAILQIDRDGHGDNWDNLIVFEDVAASTLNFDGLASTQFLSPEIIG
ncbi:hypothetical protein LTR94_002352 [Friedmanniomyces endolithicus]|nr:hypothetical protein LTR94_002352 [Friedmanniomyces endolithicus]